MGSWRRPRLDPTNCTETVIQGLIPCPIHGPRRSFTRGSRDRLPEPFPCVQPTRRHIEDLPGFGLRRVLVHD